MLYFLQRIFWDFLLCGQLHLHQQSFSGCTFEEGLKLLKVNVGTF